MGLYTKKVKDVSETPVKEVKKKGRPKKSEIVETKELEVEQPKVEEVVQEDKEPQKVEEVKEQLPPVQKTPPPPEPVEEPLPLKKTTRKKKETVPEPVYKEKVQKKVAEKKPKEEDPPAWFKKFVSELGHNPQESKKVNTDVAKETATKLWNDRVKPKNSKSSEGYEKSTGYENLYRQIFGR